MSVRTRKYHLFLVRYDGSWCLEFGDYCKQTVLDERDDFTQSHNILARDCKVISCGDSQRAINEAIASIN